MKTIKARIEKLIDTQHIDIHQIGLYSISGEYYEAAKILQNNGIFPSAIVKLFDNENLEVESGIPFSRIDLFLKNNKNPCIFVDKKSYLLYRNDFKNKGLIINKNLIIDFEIKSFSFYIMLFLYDLNHTRKNILRKVIGKLKAIKTYSKAAYNLICGYNVYRKIRTSASSLNTPIYVYDYSGMGDVFVFCLLLNGNMGQIENGEFLLTVIGNVSKRITEMFSLNNVIKLTAKESKNLTYLAGVLGNDLNIHPMTPFPAHLYTDIYSHYIYGKKLNMLEAYQYTFLSLKRANISYPNLKTDSATVTALFEKYELTPQNTVIISPYANTILGYPKEFWENIVASLVQNGFDVCTNCTGREQAIKGAKAFPFSLECSEEVINYAGYFLGIRSGFCDVICNSNAFKYIVYPDYPIFNSNVYEFCSLRKMGIGKNFREICWDYTDLNVLQKHIIKSFIHAKLYNNAKENDKRK